MEYEIVTLLMQSYFILSVFSRGFPLYLSTYPKFSTVLHTLFTKMWKTVNKCVEKRNLNEVSFLFTLNHALYTIGRVARSNVFHLFREDQMPPVVPCLLQGISEDLDGLHPMLDG